jgi:hypothetical protein
LLQFRWPPRTLPAIPLDLISDTQLL